MDRKKQFEKIYRDHISSLYRFIYSKVGNQQRAEDIASKVVTTAYQKYISSEEIVEKPLAWLFTFAKNELRNNYRKRAYETDLNPALELPDLRPTLLEGEVKSEIVSFLQQEIGKLDPVEKDIILLKSSEEMSFKEIAELHEIPESTVKSLYYRALAELKAHYKVKYGKQVPMGMLLAGFVFAKEFPSEVSMGKFSSSFLSKLIKSNVMDNLSTEVAVAKTTVGSTSSLVKLIAVVSTAALLVGGPALYYYMDSIVSTEKEVVYQCKVQDTLYTDGSEFTLGNADCLCVDGNISCSEFEVITNDAGVVEKVVEKIVEKEVVKANTYKSINGWITNKYVINAKNYIDFKDNATGSTKTYEVSPAAFILLFESPGSDSWSINYSFNDFVEIDKSNLDLVFGEGANGYQITVVDDSMVVFLKNGISVP